MLAWFLATWLALSGVCSVLRNAVVSAFLRPKSEPPADPDASAAD